MNWLSYSQWIRYYGKRKKNRNGMHVDWPIQLVWPLDRTCRNSLECSSTWNDSFISYSWKNLFVELVVPGMYALCCVLNTVQLYVRTYYTHGVFVPSSIKLIDWLHQNGLLFSLFYLYNHIAGWFIFFFSIFVSFYQIAFSISRMRLPIHPCPNLGLSRM